MSNHRASLYLLLSGLLVMTIDNGFAGAYLGTGEGNAASITHAPNYFGTGGELDITFCIAPDSESISAADISAQNVTTVWNALQANTDNIRSASTNNIPPGRFDFESVLLHEMGHCLGLAHPNLASESELTGNDQNFTQAQTGPNGNFNISAGLDLVIGSADDIRGDDINRHWFRVSDNNPFVVGNLVDRRTYSADLSDLPAGDNYAANGSRRVGVQLGFINTEAVMQQGTSGDEAQRLLAADDVATLRLGQAGVDELQGTADDYTVQIEYVGVSDDCDIQLMISGEDFAFCRVPFGNIAPNHFSVVTVDPNAGPAVIQVASTDEVNWFFNDQVAEPPPADEGPSGSWFNPARNGEGFVIEVLSGTLAGFYWFTFPPLGSPGQQQWLLAVGEINGNTFTFDNVRIASGAIFGDAFDPQDIVRENWGTLTFEFSDDATAIVTYAGPPEFGSDSYPIQRFISLDENAATALLPPEISGSWFDPATDGEGWVIEVIDASRAAVYWFTYDENGNQAWNGGVADIIGNTLVLPDARDSSGAAFGDDFNSDDIQRRTFGSLSFVFDDCNNGTLTFDTVRGAGVRNIQRITNIRGFSCENFATE